jgi:hypothetical protein|uniref:Rhodanese domain-containing protein n=1 Tax=viral metagenome TaxID=1070528 RepID=A0A6C0CPM8_9ZZZZ
MFSFFSSPTKRLNFENVQYAIKNIEKYCLINTLPFSQQKCLIKHTLDAGLEEKTINDMLHNFNVSEKIIIVYGKNSDDESAINKLNQLSQLGVKHVFLYSGGLFEWLLLQDIYGDDNFPTTDIELDILRYKSSISNIS